MLTNGELFIRLALAAALGSAIGIERERLLWTAGLRTHMLVCVGSALIMIVSAFGFTDVLMDQHVVLDPSRIAAQVVSGIGFLGAGTILLRGEIIKGLTTAASLWTVAAVGLAVGAGLYVAALATTVIVLIILAGIKPIEERFRARQAERTVTLMADRGSITVDKILEATELPSSRIKLFSLLQQDDATDAVTVSFTRLPQQALDDAVARLHKAAGVKAVTIVN